MNSPSQSLYLYNSITSFEIVHVQHSYYRTPALHGSEDSLPMTSDDKRLDFTQKQNRRAAPVGPRPMHKTDAFASLPSNNCVSAGESTLGREKRLTLSRYRRLPTKVQTLQPS